MEDATNQIGKHSRFLRFYFYLLAVSTAIMMAQPGLFKFNLKDILQTLFTLLGFVAFFGYIYEKKIFNRLTWIILASAFFLWETGCYLFMKNPLLINLLILLALLPKYWSVALYPLVTMEEDDETRISNLRRRDMYVSKVKGVFVGVAVIATLAQILIIGIFVLMFVYNR